MDAKALADNITRYYNATPLIKFSGRKGYHVDVLLKQVVAFNPNIHPLEFVKAVYERLQEKILLGLSLPTLDKQPKVTLRGLSASPTQRMRLPASYASPLIWRASRLSRRNAMSSSTARTDYQPSFWST
ncbi:MAG: hypothetical protein QXS79_01695 [Candidatus Bathyarchaeia archaeon]